ncbi:MAG: phosphoenolpyruvate mutase [Clostridia bacterium]|nr:phosphoenolpyruvate mutase [Clostridia bacterium]
MIALILNAGVGKRMGFESDTCHKSMLEINGRDTIIGRQLRYLEAEGIRRVVMVTGYMSDSLESYIQSLGLDLSFTFIRNDRFESTNYIYSIYCAREAASNDDVLLMHGDLVFDKAILHDLLAFKGSAAVVSSALKPNGKDFAAETKQGVIRCIGLNPSDDALPLWPLYKLERRDWQIWLDSVFKFCRSGQDHVYAEDAFNTVSEQINLIPIDIQNRLCLEADTIEDLIHIRSLLRVPAEKTVYMCFSAEWLHSAHVALIHKAADLGRLTIGVMTDEAVASYKRFPLVPYAERKALFENIACVNRVVAQRELSYRENILAFKPDIVVHGDDWREGHQRPIRDEAETILASYGGRLVEFPYTRSGVFKEMEDRMQSRLSLPDIRRNRLRALLLLKPCLSIMEAHNGITGLLVEKTMVYKEGKTLQFDGMWVSSLCDATSRGKPDIELVDMSSRVKTIDEIMEVTTKPIIMDGDTGGMTEHFAYTVKTLERMGVSAVIIEDKTGLKRNSLLGVDVVQTQDSIENFAEKIAVGKASQKTKEFMIIARIESLILERGMNDALLRAAAFTRAGADGIMIHSRKKDPAEIFEFIEKFRIVDTATPLVVVPTSFNSVTEEEFALRGVNIVIYANHFTRSGFPAMQNAARLILKHHRALEADEICMSIQDIVTLIPEE